MFDYLDTTKHPNISRIIIMGITIVGVYCIYYAFSPSLSALTEIKENKRQLNNTIDRLESSNKLIKKELNALDDTVEFNKNLLNTGKESVINIDKDIVILDSKLRKLLAKNEAGNKINTQLNNDKWINVGVYKDTQDRAVPAFLGNVMSMAECVELANKKGHNVAALQFRYQCFSCLNCDYDKYGPTVETANNAWVNKVAVNINSYTF